MARILMVYGSFDGVIGGAVRAGRFSRSIEQLVRENAAAITCRPNAFFSVCMAARS